MEPGEKYQLKITDDHGIIYDFAAVTVDSLQLNPSQTEMIINVQFRGLDVDKICEMRRRREESKRLQETLKIAGLGRRALDFGD